MEFLINYLRTDVFLLISSILLILVVILYIINTIKLSKIQKNYKTFMEKIGEGKDIKEVLEKYMNKVEQVVIENNNLQNKNIKLKENLNECIQKVGIVRYSAFRDTGSDLSFTLALLNEKNNGVVLNGIYSREMSNIYAKPVENGKSEYTLSEEEEKAIQKAIEN